MYEIFEKLCSIKGITPYRFGKDMKVNSSTISTWKAKNSLAGPELAQKVADYFGVSIDFIMGKTDKIMCSECEFHYNPLDESSCKEHGDVHSAMNRAKEIYGFYLDSEYCYDHILLDLNTFTDNVYAIDIDDKISCYIDYLKCNLWTELRKNRFQIKFTSSDDYIRTQILKDKDADFMSAKLFAALCDMYGIDKTYINDSALLLARTSKNDQLLRILGHLEKLSPEMLDALEIQTKALAEQCTKE